MQRSKQHALMFLLGVFVTGGAVGFTADRVIVRDRIRDCAASSNARSMRDRMNEELGLSGDQRASLDRILDERHRQMSAVLTPVRPQMDSVSGAARQQIRAILTAEQRTKFDARLERTLLESGADLLRLETGQSYAEPLLAFFRRRESRLWR